MAAHVPAENGSIALPIVTIAVAAPGDALSHLLQLYQYDFSEIEPSDVAADGRFHQLDDVAFDHAYFVHADAALAGFALVRRRPSHAIAGERVWSMAEFFIMRRYRRASIGRRAAHLVIERHQGTWEITQTAHNGAALSFWRQVLAPYAFEEFRYGNPDDGRYCQRFCR